MTTDNQHGGVGKFKVKQTPEREGRHSANGQKIKIAAARKLTFAPAKAVKDMASIAGVADLIRVSGYGPHSSGILAFNKVPVHVKAVLLLGSAVSAFLFPPVQLGRDHHRHPAIDHIRQELNPLQISLTHRTYEFTHRAEKAGPELLTDGMI